jgi:hypothetical protein
LEELMFGSNLAVKRAVAALVSFAMLSVSFSALAANRIVWKKTKLSESSGAWKVDLEVHLDRAPDVAMVSLSFSFEPTVYYERSLVDGSDTPQLRKVPLENKSPMVEAQQVGFLDPTNAKIQNRTRFSFPLTRDRGYEAGEYKVVVEDKSTGRKFGAPQTLILEGENEPIDRRSITFDEKKKKPKQEAATQETSAPEPDPDSEEFWEGGPTEAEQKEGDLPPPASMRERPCGCRVPGTSQSPDNAVYAVSALLGAAMFARRRRAGLRAADKNQHARGN